MGVTQYGQMTAGSYMYIGPQGIVHGTTITVLNAARKQLQKRGGGEIPGMLFVSSGLGGMSGAQPKAGVISGVVSVIAEINPKAVHTRHSQGWVDEVHTSLDELIPRIRRAREQKEAVSLAYQATSSTCGNASPRRASTWTWAPTRPRSTTRGRAATTPQAHLRRVEPDDGRTARRVP